MTLCFVSFADKHLRFTEHLLYVDGGQYSDEQQPLARTSNKMYEATEANFKKDVERETWWKRMREREIDVRMDILPSHLRGGQSMIKYHHVGYFDIVTIMENQLLEIMSIIETVDSQRKKSTAGGKKTFIAAGRGRFRGEWMKKDPEPKRLLNMEEWARVLAYQDLIRRKQEIIQEDR
ncbi:4082_t:CDS:2 [Paraglomus brasilianum]|uniref:4082_t:CDS:1 n=1 Tax=Paraglomus brasilianum TaxID=144538 RepID=A0A9N9B3B8_9GLOM|nr:4082_t:CDS:2 [Paraglomus brasilianum]